MMSYRLYLTALGHQDAYNSSILSQTREGRETLAAQKQFDQGITELLTAAGFMNVPSSEVQNDPKALEAQKFVNQTVYAARQGKS